METSTLEDYPVDDACSSLAPAPAQIDARTEHIFDVGAVLTIHIESQDHLSELNVTCSSISGSTASLELRSGDTLADLETCIRDLCQWQSMSFFSDNGEDLVDLGLSVREFTRITAVNSGDRKKYEHCKERYPSVGKVLAAMKVEAFNPRSQSFNLNWTLATVPDIEPEEFDALLNAQGPAIVTDIDRSHYVQVLGPLVELSERWIMINLPWTGLETFKHQFYGALLAVARDALLPVEPHHPGIGAYFKRNEQDRVIGCDMGSGIDAYFDRTLLNRLNDGDFGLVQNWSRSTRLEVLCLLQQIAGTPRTDLGKSGDNHRLDGAMSHEFCNMLFTIQLRLVSEVCPVIVNGDMTIDMIELLAESMEYCFDTESMGYCFDILRSLGNVKDFVLDDMSEIEGDATPAAKSLQGHLNNSLAKATACDASGSLLVVAGISGELALMLAPACRRLKDQALPKSVRFILCAGFVR